MKSQSQSQSMSTSERVLSRVRSGILTTGAIIGGTCLVLAVIAVVFGFRPAIVISGSMEPQIMTGAMTVGKLVDATEVSVGDVVTVPRSTGGLVTHRVVTAEEVSGGVSLTLKGDANDVADAQPYFVKEVYLVVASVPLLGAIVEAMRTTTGFIMLGSLGLLVVFVYLWRPKRQPIVTDGEVDPEPTPVVEKHPAGPRHAA
jgi:signal peptidase